MPARQYLSANYFLVFVAGLGEEFSSSWLSNLTAFARGFCLRRVPLRFSRLQIDVIALILFFLASTVVDEYWSDVVSALGEGNRLRVSSRDCFHYTN